MAFSRTPLRGAPSLRAIILTGTMALLLTASAAAQGLFDGVSLPPQAQAAGHMAERAQLRARVVNVDLSQIDRTRGRSTPRIDLNLFSDADFEGIVERRMGQAGGGETLFGRLAEGGHFSLRIEGDVLVGSVHGPDGKLYQIGRRTDGLHEITEMDPAEMPTCGYDEAPRPTEADTEGGAAPPQTSGDNPVPDDGSLIDVMVCYTPAARDAAGGVAGMEAMINLAVDETNLAYEHSQITQRLRLVHTHMVNYDSAGNMNDDLSKLRGTADGIMDEIHAMRNTYGADMVSLIVQNGSYCGIGYLMTSTSFSFDGYAFSVVKRSCATGYYSFGHELGHNMGCAHDPDNSSNALNPYAYGHRFGGETQTSYRTVMAYSPGTRIQWFSNPNVNYQGEPTGTSTRDNARSLNGIAATVANWRQSQTQTSTPATIALGQAIYCAGENLDITVEDGDESGSVTVTVTTATGDSETVTLTEANAGVFTGTVALVSGSASNGNGLLEIVEGDTITATYQDPDPVGTAQAQAQADCQPPSFAGLQTLTEGNGTITLGWSAATDANGPITYRIYRATTSGGQNFSTPLATTTQTAYTDSTIVFGQTYHYVARAVDGPGHEDTNTVERSGASLRVLSDFSISPIAARHRVGGEFDVTITALDQGGQPLESHAGPANLVAVIGGVSTPGALSQAQTGTFVDGVWTGTLSVNQAGGSVQLRVTSGSTSEMSNTFTVVQVTFAIGDAQVIEGDSGSTTLSAVVTANEWFSGLSVNWATSNGTAQAGSDYTAASGTVSFPTGSTSQQVQVSVLGDTISEPTETFQISLSGAQGGLIADDTATVTILDNDSAPVLSIADATVTEGDSGTTDMVFTVSLSAPTQSTVTVNHQSQGSTATSGVDFTSVSGALVFNALETEKTITVPVIGDTDFEADETLSVILSFPGGATLGDSQAVGTILNDDVEPLPTVSLSPATASLGESGGQVQLTVTLSETRAQDITVTVEAANGTATAGQDYQSPASPVTIPAGTTSKVIPVTLLDDQQDESDETFTVSLTGATGAELSGNVSTTITILDNDEPAVPTINISTPAVSVGEAAGTAQVTLLLSEPSSQTVVANVQTTGVTATAGSDFATPATSVTFNPGVTSRALTVTILDDSLDESDETLTVSLTSATNANLGEALISTVTIVDDDAAPLPTVSISTPSVSVGEAAGTAQVSLVLSAASAQTIVATLQTVGNTATVGSDFQAPGTTVSFAPGTTSRSLAITVINDPEDENDETIDVTLVSATNATIGAPSAAVVTIVDDDEAPLPTVSISTPSVSVGEAAGAAQVSLVLSAASTQTIVATLQTVGNTATVGSDFQAPGTTVSFSPGTTSRFLSITIINDTEIESSETLTVTLVSAVNANVGTPAAATVTITDNDVAPVPTLSIATPSVSVGEGAGTAQVSFSLSEASDVTVTATVQTVGNTATAGSDYQSPATSISFNPGETSKSLAISIIDDTADEANETLTVSVTGATNADLGSPLSATVTIIDNDEPAGLPVVSVGNSTVIEGNNGKASLFFVVRLSEPSTDTASVSYATVDGTAIAGQDYTSKSGTVTFQPGETQQTVKITVDSDRDPEPDETFSLILSNAVGAAIGDGEGTATIINDDGALLLPDISISDASVEEGDSGTADLVFTVSLSGPSDVEITVSHATQDGTATAGEDYTAASGTLTFAPTETEKTITVSVIGDTSIEAHETLEVVLSDPVGGILGESMGEGTILNDDVPVVPTVNIATPSVSQGEGSGEAVITLTLSEAVQGVVSVIISTAGETATAGSDFVAPGTSVTFPAGSTSQTMSVSLIDDSEDEDDETLTVTVVAASGADLGFNTIATVTILDDDETVSPVPSIRWSQSQTDVGEADTQATMAVELSEATDVAVRVTINSQRGRARAGADYVGLATEVVFLPGETSHTVSVSILEDVIFEQAEDFSLRLSNPIGGTIESDTLQINIVDNDERNSASRKYLLEDSFNMTDEEILAADVNQDGMINAADVVSANLLDQMDN